MAGFWRCPECGRYSFMGDLCEDCKEKSLTAATVQAKQKITLVNHITKEGSCQDGRLNMSGC